MATQYAPTDDQSARTAVTMANAEFYHRWAGEYDSYECCVFDAQLQRMLETDLDRISSGFSSAPRVIHCLDCGGGTGNLTLKMLKRGWSVTVVDVSVDMLDVLRKKIAQSQFTATLIKDSIENFLSSTDAVFDLVAFSSVLHHLYSPLSVIDKATERIRLGGFFYSNFDRLPSTRPALTYTFHTLEASLVKCLRAREDILPGVARRFRKLFSKTDPVLRRTVASVGDLAEYHDRTGIDGEQVVNLLKAKNFRVEGTKYTMGVTPLTRFINHRLRLTETLKVIAQRRGERT
jgi:2-polyprenyl-3-methyl-5-hydroxy-6-metoxy-1,4-benzoquinol methylase